MLLAARLREELGMPGLSVAQTVPFRDKERMKQLLDAAGLRTPWHTQARTVADVWAAAERVGYPLIVKPIDGAGSADTYRADSAGELDSVLPMIRHVPVVSLAQFVHAEQFPPTPTPVGQPVAGHYTAASIFKRARGAGRITQYEGLDDLLAEYGDHVVALELLPVGAPRRDWRATLIGDGMVIVRHPDLSQTQTMAQRFAADLRLYAA